MTDPNQSSDSLPFQRPGDGPPNADEFVREIHETADKLQRDDVTRGDAKLLSRSLKELRYAFKVFRPFRLHRKVTVFGSARTAPDHPDYLMSVEFGRRMASAGWMVVTGAGGGIMEGAHVGAGLERSMGVNILLPFEQEANRIIAKDEKLVTFRYFFTRKLMFVKEVNGVALFPGGFGTQDELYETLTLLQTGKRDLIPVVCLESPGGDYWQGWDEFVRRQLLDRQLISEEDLSLYKLTTSIEEATKEIGGFYRVYHSMRYIREQLILRLQAVPTAADLDQMNTLFADILLRGKIELTKVHPFESDDVAASGLPRIAMYFNRRNAGRLRQLIDWINTNIQLD